MDDREGVGENGTVSGGESGDEGSGERVLERRPRGSADFVPEMLFGAEMT